MRAEQRLRAIKLVHTIVWAGFASAILAIPIAAALDWWTLTSWLIAAVTAECLVLAFNRMRCPLTVLAARYTPDRSDNFDIYLPLWLARYNKVIFESLFAVGLAFTAVRWGRS